MPRNNKNSAEHSVNANVNINDSLGTDAVLNRGTSAKVPKDKNLSKNTKTVDESVKNADPELLGKPALKRQGPLPEGILPPEDFGLLGHAHSSEKAFATDATKTLPKGEKTPEERFAELQEITKSYLTLEEEQKLALAYNFADDAHAGTTRKGGEPFISHPVEVAIILADLKMDSDTLCAALLHDTVEDTDVTCEQVAEIFGDTVEQLVDGVTKITRVEVETLSDKQAATIRKMFVAMSKDIRVIVIKLADRLHNMRTLAALREDRRIFKARETLEIYAPIAHRLGINSIKWELEDLSFYYLEPHKFRQVARMVTESRSQREAYLKEVMDILRAEMEKVGVDCQIMGRPKHLYSIYQKMVKKQKGFSEIYDLIAVRIITTSIKDCYSALGAVHTLWHPMPGRFKDYIAMPKFNMYQSLHTTVIGPAARPLEVQIRTQEMHRQSEYGVAAHWRYKENGGKSTNSVMDKQLSWLRQMVDWQDDSHDSREFLKDLKVDLAPSEVFVFTPKGEVMSLRAGSTPVDFAYAIHTEVGNHCVGAKVNGSIVPLAYELQLGDRVEVLTQKTAMPSRDWLGMVKTPSARNKIRAYFSKISRSDDMVEGREKLALEMRKHGLGISNAKSERAIKAVSANLGYKSADEMFINIGAGRETPVHVTNRLLMELGHKQSTQQPDLAGLGARGMTTDKLPPMLTLATKKTNLGKNASNGVVVEGIEGALVRLSRCCTPVPGDEIIGFITRGRGVSVHRRDCPNAKGLMQQSERIMKVHWESKMPANTSFRVEVHISAVDRLKLLADVVEVLSDMAANVLNCNTTSHRDSMVEMRFLFQVSEISHIDIILKKLKALDGVFEATRI